MRKCDSQRNHPLSEPSHHANQRWDNSRIVSRVAMLQLPMVGRIADFDVRVAHMSFLSAYSNLIHLWQSWLPAREGIGTLQNRACLRLICDVNRSLQHFELHNPGPWRKWLIAVLILGIHDARIHCLCTPRQPKLATLSARICNLAWDHCFLL